MRCGIATTDATGSCATYKVTYLIVVNGQDVGFSEKIVNQKKITFFAFQGLTLDESQHITPKLAALQ